MEKEKTKEVKLFEKPVVTSKEEYKKPIKCDICSKTYDSGIKLVIDGFEIITCEKGHKIKEGAKHIECNVKAKWWSTIRGPHSGSAGFECTKCGKKLELFIS